MKIGDIVKATGISKSTIRFYDREGLLDIAGVVVERGKAGVRTFSADAPERIVAIYDERLRRRNEALTTGSFTVFVAIPLVGGVSINHCYTRLHTAKGVIRKLTSPAATWKEITTTLIRLQARKHQSLFVGQQIERVDVALHAYFKDKAHQSDLDNLKKLLSDAIKVAIGVDDKLFNFVDADPEYDKDAPRLEIAITPRYRE